MLTEHEYDIQKKSHNISIISDDTIKKKGGTLLINYNYKNKKKNNGNRFISFRNKGEILA